jgi:hypothetical protein
MICTDLNSVLRVIFGSQMYGVTGEWRTLHYGVLTVPS